MKRIALFVGPVLALCTVFLMSQFASIPPEAARVAGLCVWMAIWWMTEPVPLELTALLPMLVLPLSGLYPKDAMMRACAPYANESVYFFLGGFGLGLAIEKTQLHRVGALVLLRVAGTHAGRVVGAFMVCTAGLSMWINNTATTMLMLPLRRSSRRSSRPDSGLLATKYKMLPISFNSVTLPESTPGIKSATNIPPAADPTVRQSSLPDSDVVAT